MPSTKLGDRRLVVVGGERRRQPQPERPPRRERRAAGECGVALHDLPWSRAVDRRGSRARRPAPRTAGPRRPPSHLERHPARAVDEDAEAGVGHEEGQRLVGLLAGGAAVLVPGVDRLAVLDEGAEALTEAVDVGADRQGEALHQVGRSGAVGALDDLHGAQGGGARGREHGIRRTELERPGTVDGHPCGEVAGAQRHAAPGGLHRDLAGRGVQLEVGHRRGGSHPMGRAHGDDVGGR